MTMLEDFWLPRRDGGKGTEITTLPAGANLGEMDDVMYFQKKLYRSLNVPISRLEPDEGFALGRASEISRDEVKYQKFIRRLQLRFAQLFQKLLQKQLLLKHVIAEEDWDIIRDNLKFIYSSDNHFAELKDMEITKERVDLLNSINEYVGIYFSKEYVKKHILRFNDNDIAEIDKQIAVEEPIEQEGEEEEGGENNGGVKPVGADTLPKPKPQ